MELNRTMILLSGCFLIVWSTFKWKIPHVIWDVKLTRVCSVILGLYNIILAICFEKDLSIFLKGLGLLKTSIFSANNKSVIHFYSTGNKNQLSCFHTIPIIKY